MDLLKVLIIGPSETVYNGSYFLFDMYLPPSYPNEPPQCFYHSGGYKLHPNLYENGHICRMLGKNWMSFEFDLSIGSHLQ